MANQRYDGVKFELDPVFTTALSSELSFLDRKLVLGAAATMAALNGREYPDDLARSKGMPRGFFALYRGDGTMPGIETWGVYSSDEQQVTLTGLELKGKGYLTIFLRDSEDGGGRELVVSRIGQEDTVLPVGAENQEGLEVAKLAVASAAQDYLNHFVLSSRASQN